MTPEEGLAAWFADERGREVKIENLSQSTAGARRRNLLFDAVSDDGVEPLVATALPTADIELVDVGTEAAVRELAADAGVATPRIRGVCTDTKYLGGPFFLSERLDGETIPRRVLRQAERTGNGETVVRELGTALARLHSIDAAKAPEKLLGPPDGDPITVTLARLRELMSELLQPEPAFSYGLRWLEDHRPDEPARCSIVHGDARNGNLIVSEKGLVGILDWEGAHVGDAMDDVRVAVHADVAIRRGREDGRWARPRRGAARWLRVGGRHLGRRPISLVASARHAAVGPRSCRSSGAASRRPLPQHRDGGQRTPRQRARVRPAVACSALISVSKGRVAWSSSCTACVASPA